MILRVSLQNSSGHSIFTFPQEIKNCGCLTSTSWFYALWGREITIEQEQYLKLVENSSLVHGYFHSHSYGLKLLQVAQPHCSSNYKSDHSQDLSWSLSRSDLHTESATVHVYMRDRVASRVAIVDFLSTWRLAVVPTCWNFAFKGITSVWQAERLSNTRIWIHSIVTCQNWCRTSQYAYFCFLCLDVSAENIYKHSHQFPQKKLLSFLAFLLDILDHGFCTWKIGCQPCLKKLRDVDLSKIISKKISTVDFHNSDWLSLPSSDLVSNRASVD